MNNMKQWIRLMLMLGLCLPTLSFAIGAIAIDDEQGDYAAGYGVSTGNDTKSEAQREAMRLCREAGNEDCRVVAWFETCGAYAASKTYYGAGWGATARAAQRMALDKCGSANCRIIQTECEE
jgi:hypothetical protein